MPGTDSESGCWPRLRSSKKRSNPNAKHTGKEIGAQDAQTKAELDPMTCSLALHLCCPACDTLLLQPVSLPCGHCLCQPCLEGIRKKPSSTKASDAQQAQPYSQCPRCLVHYSLQPGGAWPFPENLLLANVSEQLLERLEGLRQVKQPKNTRAKDTSLRVTACEICSKQREAQHYCRTCGLNYCAKCLRKLHGNRAFQAHVLTEPVEGGCRDPCPTHHDRSLSHCCLDDGALGCQGCMEQGHQGHDVSPVHEARARREVGIRNWLEQAEKVKSQCEADMVSMDQLRARTGSDGAELRRRVREGFLSLRNVLLDQEAALLSHLDNLTSSTRSGARDFLQTSAPLLGSLTGLEVISEQALLEPDTVAFLTGAVALTQWLQRVNGDIHRPALTLQEGEPFKGVKMDFDALFRDLQGLLGTHLHWKSPEVDAVVSAATSVESDVLGGCCEVLQVPSCPGTPHRTLALADPPLSPLNPKSPRKLVMEEQLGLSAGDCSDKKRHLLPRPPIIYQHIVSGDTVEIFWMLPMGEEVETFDVHFQDAVIVGMTMEERKGVVLEGLKTCNLQTAGLRLDTHYLFRARSVNSHGAGEWSSSYRVNTERQGDEAKAAVTQEI
ncbi:tripartite motif-containing protein 42 [Salmo salar]|uniref:Tripartite motif-containing protein 42 n=1 Tax=Salmo salar TaxID=8030 RepID=A0A1S3T1V3_SALSA|nr:tripartite motif-containing protein 42-like [Salmo salar]